MSSSNLAGGRESDELAKELYRFFAGKTKNSKILHEMGVFDWLNNGVPLSLDPVDIALSGYQYVYLSSPFPGNRVQGLMAVVLFLKDKTGRTPTPPQAAQAVAMVEAASVDQAAFVKWYDAIYR